MFRGYFCYGELVVYVYLMLGSGSLTNLRR